MITLSGVAGKGTLLCTAYIPDVYNPTGVFTLSGHLDGCIPVSDWYLPPPDSVWYSLTSSAYGPRLTRLEIGDIQSTKANRDGWNPCLHSTLRGDAIYRGEGGSASPYWTVPHSTGKTTFQAATGFTAQPHLVQRYLYTLKGRPCTISVPKVYDRYGDKVNQTLASGINSRYWQVDSDLPGTIAPPALQSTFSQLGEIYQSGQWYAQGYNGTLAVTPFAQVKWFKTEWTRPNRATFVRDMLCEYHTTQSYTPADRTGWTNHPYCKEQQHRITTCVVTHMRSVSKGRFEVKYDLTTDVSWAGWAPYQAYSGSHRQTVTGQTAAILVLEPGKTIGTVPDVVKANNFCMQSQERAVELYDHSMANSARTAAVNDVQELESNWLENLAGVKGTLTCLGPLLDGYKAVKKGDLRAARKALAGAYLVYSYAIAPTIRDVKDIRKQGKSRFKQATTNRFSTERRRGKSTSVDIPVCQWLATANYYSTYHLKLKDDVFSQVWSALEQFGLDPSSGQLWDLVPFSFVADWFLRIGPTLSTIDAYNSMYLHRDVLARIETFKVQWPLEEEVIRDLFDSTIYSNGQPIEYSWYDRRVFYSLGSLDLMAITDDNGLSLNQMAQGAALLTQMR